MERRGGQLGDSLARSGPIDRNNKAFCNSFSVVINIIHILCIPFEFYVDAAEM